MATSPATKPAITSRILFATDFSPCSDLALSYAVVLAAQVGAPLELLHVLPPSRPATATDVVPRVPFDQREAERQFRLLENSGKLRGVNHSILVRRGSVWQGLDEVIQSHDSDLIVIGTHGHGGMKKVLLGSRAEEIVRLAPCPVLTIGPHVPRAGADLEFKRIVYATDFLTGSLRAAPYLICFADKSQAAVTLLHAIEDNDTLVPGSPERTPKGAFEKMQNLIPADARLRLPSHVLARFGPPAETILKVAEEEKADLIVMGVRPVRAALVSTHFPRTVAHEVVSQAQCPVLTVRG
ncbi:MAG TPA: universal stress protein [Terriglobales bacterium]